MKSNKYFVASMLQIGLKKNVQIFSHLRTVNYVPNFICLIVNAKHNYFILICSQNGKSVPFLGKRKSRQGMDGKIIYQRSSFAPIEEVMMLPPPLKK